MSEVLRTCCVCRTKQDKHNMIRVSYYNNILHIDNEKNNKGKGCYICNNEECVKNLVAKKVLNRVYRCNIEQKQYTKLCEELKNCKK